MTLSKLKDIKSLSNTEISKEIMETEINLFNLYFRKASRQNFKSHELKTTRRYLAQLKTFLTIRLQNLESNN